jgi:short chain dehydrogenase
MKLFQESSMIADENQNFPPQRQDHQPGRESEMRPKPSFEPRFQGAAKLKDKVAIVTGGDSGIGRAVAVHMAREGADIAIVYLEEGDDAAETARCVAAEGRRCLTISGDVSNEELYMLYLRSQQEARMSYYIQQLNAAVASKQAQRANQRAEKERAATRAARE